MRIFFGATLPENTKTQILKVQEELRPLFHDARFEGEDKLHITLQFIGEFDVKKSSELFSSVEAEVKESLFESFSVEIVGINFFPNEKVRRGIWLECRDDGTLSRIAEAIKSVTKEFGIIPESRSFKAHITVARLKEGKGTSRFSRNDSVEDLKKFESEDKLHVEKFFPMSIAMFESVLKPSGSEYKMLSQVTLLPRQA